MVPYTGQIDVPWNSKIHSSKFDLTIYQCTDINCVVCDAYDEVEKKGICSECTKGYKISDSKTCIHTGDEGLIELLSSLTRLLTAATSSFLALNSLTSFVRMGPSVFIMMH